MRRSREAAQSLYLVHGPVVPTVYQSWYESVRDRLPRVDLPANGEVANVLFTPAVDAASRQHRGDGIAPSLSRPLTRAEHAPRRPTPEPARSAGEDIMHP
jgi:hypothetical protein